MWRGLEAQAFGQILQRILDCFVCLLFEFFNGGGGRWLAGFGRCGIDCSAPVEAFGEDLCFAAVCCGLDHDRQLRGAQFTIEDRAL